MPNGKIQLHDLDAVSRATSEISDLLKVMTVVQQAIDSHGSGESKRDVLRSDTFRKLVDRLNGDELEAILAPVVPAVKRIVRQKADELNRVYGTKIEVPE